MLLLDTHALVWLATDLSQLTDAAKSAIRFHSTELHVSSVSALEISPPIHRDPFDRIIIAAAQVHGMAIRTKNRTIPTYARVKAVWE
jgi:PIN domain nuclease of toxin-antitoxin system